MLCGKFCATRNSNHVQKSAFTHAQTAVEATPSRFPVKEMTCESCTCSLYSIAPLTTKMAEGVANILPFVYLSFDHHPKLN